jgi:hypothetical protein
MVGVTWLQVFIVVVIVEWPSPEDPQGLRVDVDGAGAAGLGDLAMCAPEREQLVGQDQPR